MRALTGSDVLVADKLFATLDTTVRALHPESVPRVLLSDTVGFIENLPHDLVVSFKSTLEEAKEASLLLHVVDASDPGFERQLEVTNKVLEEIDAQAVPRIHVFNKIDCVGDVEAQAAMEARLRAQYPDCMALSARRDGDIQKLRARLLAFFRRDLVDAEIFLACRSRNCAATSLKPSRCWRSARTMQGRSSTFAASRRWSTFCVPNSAGQQTHQRPAHESRLRRHKVCIGDP